MEKTKYKRSPVRIFRQTLVGSIFKGGCKQAQELTEEDKKRLEEHYAEKGFKVKWEF